MTYELPRLHSSCVSFKGVSKDSREDKYPPSLPQVQPCTSSLLLSLCIGSTTSTRRLCDLSSTGKFGRGEAEAKLSQGGKTA